MKKIIKRIIVVFVIIFTMLNIVWICFYISQRTYLRSLMQKFELTEALEIGKGRFINKSADPDYMFFYKLPGYLCFRVRFQAVGNYNISSTEDGRTIIDKKYHSSFVVNRLFWEKNWFTVEIDQSEDEDGYYIENSVCERIDYYPGFNEKKVWFGISDKKEDDVRAFYEEAHDEIMNIYNKAVMFFGDRYIK